MRRRLIYYLLFLLSFAGCGKKEKTVSSPRFVHLAFGSDICSLDPRLSSEFISAHANRMLYEGLMRMEPNGEVAPAVAESFEISQDKKRYTFHLRSTKWSNGDPVTAYDFAYAWTTTLCSELSSGNTRNFYCIKNARALLQKEVSVDQVGIQALDEKTLVVDLEHPTSYFLEVISMPCFFPVNARVDRENPQWSRQAGTSFVCNGPFHLQERKPGDEFTVVKNPSYWDAEHVRLAGIKVVIIPDALTHLQLFEKGELDWLGKPIGKMTLDALPTLKREKKLNYSSAIGMYWYFLNTEKFPFTNKKMRQAFAYAIDRRTLVENMFEGGETAACSVMPEALALQSEPYFPDGDLARARELFHEGLQELGITEEQFPQISLGYTQSPTNHQIAQVVQEQWHKAFGIWVQLYQQEWKTYYDNLKNGNFQIGGLGWSSWIRDPIYTLATFKYRSDRLNIPRWENNHYQELLSASDEEIDERKRRAFLHQAEQILMEEMPIIPVCCSRYPYAKNPHLQGVYCSEVYEIDFRWAYFDDQ